MSFVVSQGPPVYNPQTWHYTQEYRQRFKLDRPSPSQSTQQTRAVKFGGRVLEPSPANLPWPRTPALKPATNDNWGIHQAPTEPNTPVGSRSSSPVPEIGEPVTPAMLLPRPSDENAEVPIPLRRSRRPRKEKTPPAEDAQGLKWPISVHKWLNQLMETCTDNEQRRILGNGLDPLMEQYAAYIRMEGLEQPAPSASAMAGPSTLPHMRDIEEETEVESLVLGSDRMEDTRSGEENPNEAFHDVLSSVLVAVIPSSGKHPTSSASKGKRRLDDKDGPQEPVDGESDPASPHAKKIRMSVDVESRRYQKASVAEQKGVAPSPQSSFHGPTQVSLRNAFTSSSRARPPQSASTSSPAPNRSHPVNSMFPPESIPETSLPPSSVGRSGRQMHQLRLARWDTSLSQRASPPPRVMAFSSFGDLRESSPGPQYRPMESTGSN